MVPIVFICNDTIFLDRYLHPFNSLATLSSEKEQKEVSLIFLSLGS